MTTVKELENERVKVKRIKDARCSVDNCYRKGDYERCYLDNYELCPMYQIKKEHLKYYTR